MFKKILVTTALLASLTVMAEPQVIETGHNVYVLPDDLQQGELSPRYTGPGKAIYCSSITQDITEYRGTWVMVDCTGDVPSMSDDGDLQWILLWCEPDRCYDAEGGNGPQEDIYANQYFLIPVGFDIVMDDGLYLAVSKLYQVEQSTPNPGNSPQETKLPYKTYNSLSCSDDGTKCSYEFKVYTIDQLRELDLVPVFQMEGGSDGSNLPDDTVCINNYCKDSKGNILGVWVD